MPEEKEPKKLTRRQFLAGGAALVGDAFLSGCQSEKSAPPAQEPSPQPTSQPTVKPTEAPTPVPTLERPTIQPTPEPSPTPNSTPTATLRPTLTVEPTFTSTPQEGPEARPEELKQLETAVEIRRPIYWGNRDRPEVTLTFDDGFSRSSVAASLEVLRANEVKTTFFVVGRQLEAYPDLWRQALADGHEICNHTYTHSYLTTLSSEQIKEEIDRWEKAAKEVLGEEYVERMKQEFAYIRFPGGSGHRDNRVLRVVSEAGYLPIAWSADTYYAVLKNHDYRNEPAGPIAQEVASHIVSTSQNGSIILLHFNVWDVTRLEEMVAGIERKGLRITTVSEVLREEPEPD